MCHWPTLLLLSSSFSSSQKSTLDNQILLTCSRGNISIVCTFCQTAPCKSENPSLCHCCSSTHPVKGKWQLKPHSKGLTIPNTSKMKCTTYCRAVFNTVTLFACKYTVQGEGFREGWVWHQYPAKQGDFGQHPHCLVLHWKSWALLNPV